MNTNEDRLLARDHLHVALKVARRTLRHVRPGLLAFLVGVLLTLALLAVRPTQYLSQTVLHYREGFQWDVPSEGRRGVGHRLRESVLARSRLQQVVEELGLFPKLVAAGKMEEAVEEMRRRTSFRVNEGETTFTIAFVGSSPAEAQRATAKLAERLINDSAQQRSGELERAKGFLDAQRQRTEELLRQKEAELARLLAKHPELAQAGSASDGVMRVPPQPQAAPDSQRPPVEAPRDPRVAELAAAERQAQANLATAKRAFDEQSARFTEKHPAVVSAAARLKEAEALYQRAADALRAAEPPRERRPPARGPVANAQPRIRVETLEEHARLTRELAEERDRFQKLDARQFVATMAATSFTGGHSAQITVIDPANLPARPTGTSERVLLIAGIAAALGLGLGAAFIAGVLDDRVYDRHDVERLRLVPVVGEVTGLEAAGGVSAVVAGGGSRSSKDAAAVRSLASARQGRARSALPPAVEARVRALPAGAASGEPLGNTASSLVLAQPTSIAPARGESPWDVEARESFAASPGSTGEDASPTNDSVDARALLLRAPDSPAAASFRVLRHRLAERGELKSILVTSPGIGEGKTTCALNLALALCEAGRARVLLLDANFRRPALSQIFQGRRPGTVDGRAEVHPAQPWAVIEPVTTWLDFASIPPDSASRLVDGFSMRLRLEQLGTAGYDHIVIDGPAVLGSADVNVIEDLVSAVLLTSWSRRSRASGLREAVDQIGARKVLGVVVMGS